MSICFSVSVPHCTSHISGVSAYIGHHIGQYRYRIFSLLQEVLWTALCWRGHSGFWEENVVGGGDQ